MILISIDGMRPDGLQQCGNPYVKELEKICSYTYNASSMNPSVTIAPTIAAVMGISRDHDWEGNSLINK